MHCADRFYKLTKFSRHIFVGSNFAAQGFVGEVRPIDVQAFVWLMHGLNRFCLGGDQVGETFKIQDTSNRSLNKYVAPIFFISAA